MTIEKTHPACWPEFNVNELMTVILMISWSWWMDFDIGNIILVTSWNVDAWHQCDREFWWPKSLPSSYSCHQHISSPKSVTNIDSTSRVILGHWLGWEYSLTHKWWKFFEKFKSFWRKNLWQLTIFTIHNLLWFFFQIYNNSKPCLIPVNHGL